jgi:hypothetical protein
VKDKNNPQYCKRDTEREQDKGRIMLTRKREYLRHYGVGKKKYMKKDTRRSLGKQKYINREERKNK